MRRRRPWQQRMYSAIPPLLLLILLLHHSPATVSAKPPGEHGNSLRDSEEESSADAALPLFERDGLLRYSLANSSVSLEESRLAFQQLKADDETEDAPPLPPIPFHSHRKLKNRRKNKGKGRSQQLKMYKEELLDPEDRDLPRGWRNAIAVANPTALKDDKSHCQGQKFKQQIKEPGCLSKMIVNRLCHGSCPSIFIPRIRAKKLKPIFQSCSVCRPSQYDTMTVELDCPGREPLKKSIVLVKACSCMNLD